MPLKLLTSDRKPFPNYKTLGETTMLQIPEVLGCWMRILLGEVCFSDAFEIPCTPLHIPIHAVPTHTVMSDFSTSALTLCGSPDMN